MTKSLKHKNADYKFHKVDIWGIIRSLKLIRRVYPRQRYNNFRVRRRSFLSFTRSKRIFIFFSGFTRSIFLNKFSIPLAFNKFSFYRFSFFLVIFIMSFLSSLRIHWGIFLDTSKFFTNLYNKYLSRKNLKFFVNCINFFNIGIKKSNFVSLRSNNLSRFFYKRHLLRRERYRNRKKPFYFRLDTRNIRFRKRKMNKKFISIRLTKLFFITLTHRQFRKSGLKSKKKDGFFEQII